MIKLDISTALFLYLFFAVIGVFALWIWLDRAIGFEPYGAERKNIWQCSVCHYVYVDSNEADFSRCPRCKSINQKGVRSL